MLFVLIFVTPIYFSLLALSHIFPQINCLAAVGGRIQDDLLRNILKVVMKGPLALKFNLTGGGSGGKLPFKKLKFREAVYGKHKYYF